MEYTILAQIFSLIGYLLFAISFWQKKYESVMYIQIAGLVSLMIQFILLKAYSGAAIDLVNIIKTCFFAKRKKDSVYHLVFFGTLTLFGVLLTWTDVFSIFSLIAGLSYLIASYSKELQRVRAGAVLSSISWIVYDVHSLAYVSCVCEVGTIVSNIIALIRYGKMDRVKEDECDRK